MQQRLLNLLACPDCRARVERDRDRLICTTCKREFEIRNGIPRLLPREMQDRAREERSAEHFTAEFTVGAKGDADIDRPELLDYYFFSRTGLDPKVYEVFGTDDHYPVEVQAPYTPDTRELQNKIVLDAGCGPARFTPVAARAASYVVGLDLGDHVERAAARCRHLDNVDFVQGSVLAPPFLPEAFDLVYSIGVLHHTPDPRGGTLRLSELVKPNGAFALWVYPPEYWGGALRAPVSRAFHRWFRRLQPRTKERVARRVLMPLGRMQARLAKRRWSKLLGAPLFLLPVPRHPGEHVMLATILDYYGPPYIATYAYDEVREWLSEAGFRDLTKVPVPTAWLARDRGGERGR
ncbi:MAG TPA: methyltransferase domain-containing protein [Thermoanaerobaculia bacterium]|nr:methyltransferase domain-containing protein [Thermoanaerobaculia bacterium]